MKKEAPTITLSPIITVTQRVSSRQPNSKISKKRATNKKQKPPPLHLSLPLHKYLCNFLKPILQQSDSSNKEFYSHSLPQFISMGSCISKCKRKRKHQVEPSHVEDKLVISRAPPPASSLSFSSTKKQPLDPNSPTSASSSVSSVSCTTRNTSNSCSLTSSLSSTSSISSSVVSSKERSFSNEFLYSCVKENPQIIRVDPVRGVLKKPAAVKNYSPDSIQSRQFSSIPQKRARANSPVLSRQKSFRREIEISNYANSIPSRNLRSPSPSRRFGVDHNYRGDLKNRHKDFCCQNSVVAKENAVSSGILSAKRENIRPSSPCNNSGRNRGYLMNRETSVYRIGSKIDEFAVGEEFSSKRDVDVIPMEDIDNPLIALDCFIFL